MGTNDHLVGTDTETTDKMKTSMNTNKYVRQFLAETLGTFALVIFGDGAVAQVVLGNAARGDTFFGGFLNICLGYGLALMIGICISGGVSGGHLNPAVTLTMAALRKIKIIQIPIYMAAQYLGAFCAALVLWGEYADIIKMVDPDYMLTHGIFASHPTFERSEVGLASLAMDQMLGTALLLIIILSVTDEQNMKISPSTAPLIIGLGLTAIHLSFGLNAGAAINPARDFSPRLLAIIAGWDKSFTLDGSWFWIPLILPHIGGLLGGLVYKLMVGAHHKEHENM